jgi:hypothetical protein
VLTFLTSGDAGVIGQAILGVFIVIGFLAQQWKSHQRAAAVRLAAEMEAQRVATIAQYEASRVAEKVESAGNETRKQLQEIHVMVDGRLDAALREMHRLREEIDDLKGDKRGTKAQEAGPDTLRGGE